MPVSRETLQKRLKTIRDDSTYLAPECKYPAWVKLVDVLNSYLHLPPILEWEKEIQAIMKGKANEEPSVVVAHKVGTINM